MGQFSIFGAPSLTSPHLLLTKLVHRRRRLSVHFGQERIAEDASINLAPVREGMATDLYNSHVIYGDNLWVHPRFVFAK